MNNIYFINYQREANGYYYSINVYRVYSGDSIEEIGDQIVSDFKEEFSPISKYEKLETLDDLKRYMDNLNIDIRISDPYTDINRLLDFWNNASAMEGNDDSVYFYGDWLIKNQKYIPYFSNLRILYNLSLTNDDFVRIINRI